MRCFVGLLLLLACPASIYSAEKDDMRLLKDIRGARDLIFLSKLLVSEKNPSELWVTIELNPSQPGTLISMPIELIASKSGVLTPKESKPVKMIDSKERLRWAGNWKILHTLVGVCNETQGKYEIFTQQTYKIVGINSLLNPFGMGGKYVAVFDKAEATKPILDPFAKGNYMDKIVEKSKTPPFLTRVSLISSRMRAPIEKSFSYFLKKSNSLVNIERKAFDLLLTKIKPVKGMMKLPVLLKGTKKGYLLANDIEKLYIELSTEEQRAFLVWILIRGKELRVETVDRFLEMAARRVVTKESFRQFAFGYFSALYLNDIEPSDISIKSGISVSYLEKLIELAPEYGFKNLTRKMIGKEVLSKGFPVSDK